MYMEQRSGSRLFYPNIGTFQMKGEVMCATYSCNRDEDLNKKACKSMLDVFILNFKEILGALLKKTKTQHSQNEDNLHINMRLKDGLSLQNRIFRMACANNGQQLLCTDGERAVHRKHCTSH